MHLQRNRYKAMFYSVAIDLTCFSVCVCLLASFCHSYPNEFWERMHSYTFSVISCSRTHLLVHCHSGQARPCIVDGRRTVDLLEGITEADALSFAELLNLSIHRRELTPEQATR